jgi:exopolyphosphatase/guanosine-5'-triphosphate,3'-diphosphate pyrophosphatase
MIFWFVAERQAETMRLAVVDLGSNTVHMSVYDMKEEGYRHILSEKELIGLIGYAQKGVLSQDGILRIVETINSFNETAKAIDVDTLSCFATAGLRSIKNADEVVDTVEKETGVRIQIISGEEEARLDFVGVMRPAELTEGLVVDMGGASTEIIRYKNNEIENTISLPYGSLYLYKRFVSKIVPNKDEIMSIRDFVSKQLSVVEWLQESAGNVCLIGGTARAIARLHKELNGRESEELQGYSFNACDFDRLLDYLVKKKKVGARDIIRVAPERIHTIMPGLIAFGELVRIAGCSTASISRGGVREGYLKEYTMRNIK